MSKTFNLLNNKFILYIGITVGIIILLILFNVIKPKQNLSDINYNFQPYPNISAKNIPDNMVNQQENSCYDTLQKCDLNEDPNLQCNSCSGDFVCKQVNHDNNINSNIEINGQIVGDSENGKGWCLPRLPHTQKCNSYTGRWVWSNDEDCKSFNLNQGKNTDKNQCWSCKCLYPDLFTGNDCSTQIACKALITNTGVVENSISKQFGNYLIATENNPSVKPGTKWNPNIDISDPSTTNDEKIALTQSPYDSINNTPYYTCQCSGAQCETNDDCINNPGYGKDFQCNTNKQCVYCVDGICPNVFNPYVNLPNDSYMCHINPCGKLYNNNIANHIKIDNFCNKSKTKCNKDSDCTSEPNDYCEYNCDCEGANNGLLTINEVNFNVKSIEDNDLYKTCVQMSDLPCNFDSRNKECICPNGVNRKCKSSHANKNDTTLPECNDPNNIIGFECFDPCYGQTCNSRGFPAYKNGKCKNDTTIPCTSNSMCSNTNPGIGNNICEYESNCSCLCHGTNIDVCDKITNLYGPNDKDDENVKDGKIQVLKEACGNVNTICNFDNNKCVSNPNALMKAFTDCNNPYYGGKNCESFFCDPTSRISCTSVDGDILSHTVTNKINKYRLGFCERQPPNGDLSTFKNYKSDGTYSWTATTLGTDTTSGFAYCNGNVGNNP